MIDMNYVFTILNTTFNVIDQDNKIQTLNFLKVYDRGTWPFFMFQVLKKIGILRLFINLFKLLFQRIEVLVNINGVWQGYAIVFFILVREALNQVIKQEMHMGISKGSPSQIETNNKYWANMLMMPHWLSRLNKSMLKRLLKLSISFKIFLTLK